MEGKVQKGKGDLVAMWKSRTAGTGQGIERAVEKAAQGEEGAEGEGDRVCMDGRG